MYGFSSAKMLVFEHDGMVTIWAAGDSILCVAGRVALKISFLFKKNILTAKLYTYFLNS